MLIFLFDLFFFQNSKSKIPIVDNLSLDYKNYFKLKLHFTKFSVKNLNFVSKKKLNFNRYFNYRMKKSGNGEQEMSLFTLQIAEGLFMFECREDQVVKTGIYHVKILIPEEHPD